jgi:putative membrane protein
VKSHLLAFFFSAAAFAVASFFLPGLNYHGSSDILIKAAVVFGLLNTFVRPLIDLVLLPLNFLTFGLIKGLSGLILLWLLTILVTGFSITESIFPGYNLGSVVIPAYQVSAIVTAILGAFFIGLVSSTLYWLTR